MNIVFFNSHTFLTRELINSLHKRHDHKSVIVTVPQYPTDDQVVIIYEQIKPFLPALVITLNDAGLDLQGELQKKLFVSGSFLVNWYHDYPFYEEIFYNRRMEPSDSRIDLVSEESFLPEMHARGFTSHFLPLATDPSFFNSSMISKFCRNIAFVGNSSSEFIDRLLTEKRVGELEKLLSLQVSLKKHYNIDSSFNIHDFLVYNPGLWQGKTDLDDREVIFCIEWMIGYLYRRDFIVALAQKYQNKFTCFGDPYWTKFLNPEAVSSEACYYDNLCKIYQSTKININVNRIQIRTSFTQRIFDCAASGAFIITDKRKGNSSLFKTSGSECELVQFDSFEHCCSLIDYYLTHEDERLKITDALKKKVLAYHTYDCRLESILYLGKIKWKL